MSGKSIIFIVILVIAVMASLMMANKNIKSRYHELEGDKKKPDGKKELEKEDPAVTAAKKDLYHYLNQAPVGETEDSGSSCTDGERTLFRDTEFFAGTSKRYGTKLFCVY